MTPRVGRLTRRLRNAATEAEDRTTTDVDALRKDRLFQFVFGVPEN